MGKSHPIGYIVRATGCWEWVGGKHRDGYGLMADPDSYRKVDGKWRKTTVLVHRYLFERAKGPIPQGLEIDHTCKNRGCVNPDHMEPIPHAMNINRGRAADVSRALKAGRMTCSKGHPWTPENTWVSPTSGHRRCRECGREHDRRRQGQHNEYNKLRQRARRLTARQPLSES